jgi:hypothetical protein
MKRNKCPATGKTIFFTQTDANATISSISSHNSLNRKKFKTNKRSNGRSQLKRSYFCVFCKGYHLTSIENMDYLYKKQKEQNEETKKYFESIDIDAWKLNSIPFDQGHIPPPKSKK